MRRAETKARDQPAPAEETEAEEGRLAHFLLPLGALIGVAWYLDDALKGVLVAVALAAVLLARRLSFAELSKSFFQGFESMVYPLAIVVMSFGLRNVNEDLGLTHFVIETVRPVMSAALLPAIAFVSLWVITTGSFWGVYAVSLPIIVPLANAMDVHMGLALGAVISAGAFGSHACFYGDATVLAASSSGCDVFDHVMTQLPYVLIAAALSTMLYLGLGFVV